MRRDPDHWTMPPTAEPAREPWRDVLMRAADLIEARGLAKKATCDEQGRHCIRGAILRVTGNTRPVPYWAYPGAPDVARTADDAITKYLGGGWNAVPNWNNAPERTAAEVCAALRAAAVAP